MSPRSGRQKLPLMPKPRAVASGCNTQLAFGSDRYRSRRCNFCRPLHGLLISFGVDTQLKCWAIFISPLRGLQFVFTSVVTARIVADVAAHRIRKRKTEGAVNRRGVQARL